MLDRKIWKLFRPRGNGQKKTKCDQFFCPTSDFLDFCNPCSFYHDTFTNDVDFVDKAYAEICDHWEPMQPQQAGYIGPQCLGIICDKPGYSLLVGLGFSFD